MRGWLNRGKSARGPGERLVHALFTPDQPTPPLVFTKVWSRSVPRSPAGHRCPLASASPTLCLAGEYQPESGTAECRACRDGQSSAPASKECAICA
eukprot:316906-Prymnesium_polylepis.1